MLVPRVRGCLSEASHCVFRSWGWEGNFQSRCWWDHHIPQEMGGVCVCVCVSKGLGGDNTVEIQVRIPAGICDGDLCVRIVMASLLVLKSSLGSALSGCEALAGFFPPLPQFSHQENGV